MASPQDNVSMALFCDFENVALGVRDANYEQFDIKPILERLLLKGSIVIKKAYCDWDRYKGFKKPMHEANFELIEIPHVRQSGKNSADIRLVVDTLDLCYTKSHVNTFVIISGDSDFSPLVSKLRENNKQVIGVGVKQSTSDLLVANCDEFIFYDDLVRENQRRAAKRSTGTRDAQPVSNRSPEEERRRKDDVESRRRKAIELAVETFDALVLERGDGGKMWASVLKEAIKRRKPDFNESYYGFRAFGNLLEEAQARGLLEFGRDEKSGTYVYRGSGSLGDAEPAGVQEGESPMEAAAAMVNGRREPREGREARKRGGRKTSSRSRDEWAADPSRDAQADLPLAGDRRDLSDDGDVAGGRELSDEDGVAGAREDDVGNARGLRDDDDIGDTHGADADDETAGTWRAEGEETRDARGDGNASSRRNRGGRARSDTASSRAGEAGRNGDVQWPDARDESPVAPWDELPASSAADPQVDPFDFAASDDAGGDADSAEDRASDAAGDHAAPGAPRKPSLVPARKRARERGRGGRSAAAGSATQDRAASAGDSAPSASDAAEAGRSDARDGGRGNAATRGTDARDEAVTPGATGPAAGVQTPAGTGAADAPTKAETPASDRRSFIGNATLLPAGAPAPAPSKAVVTRAPRRRGARTAADADAAATGAASPADNAPANEAPAATAAPGASKTVSTSKPASARKRADAAKPATDSAADAATPAADAAPRKAATRSRRPRKTSSTPDAG